MATNGGQGNVTGKIILRVDKKSWDNLDLFQKKMASVKRQMSGLDKSIKVSAVVAQVSKVQKKVSDATLKQRQKEYNAHVVMHQKHIKKLSDNEKAQAIRNSKISNAQGAAAFGSRIKQMYSGGSGARASNTMFADMMRQEVRDHAEAIRMNREFDRAAKQRQEDSDNKAAMRQRVNANKNAVTGRLANAPSGAREQMFKQGGIFDRLSANYMSGAISANDFSKSVNRATTALLRQEAAAKRAAPSMRSLRGELVQATAAFTAFSTGVNIFQTGKEFDSMQASMTLFAGNASGVKETMTFLRNESERLGINFQEAAANFTKFAIVARNKMSPQQTRELFSGFSEYATVLQVDQYRFSRGMMAIQQMMSKGKISS